MNSNRKILLSTLFIAILVVVASGITFAFFNYTRTGIANRISVGRISFNTSQNGTINLTNVFPIASSEATGENTNYDSIEITITGDTTYEEGVEYLVTFTDVNNTYSNKAIPIAFNVNEENIGEASNDYFSSRGGATSIYQLTEERNVEENKYILVGYIAPGQTGINGSINITAYIDKDKIAISDTYPSQDVTHTEASGETSVEVVDYSNGTTSEWVNGRTVLTTDEWNNFGGNNSLSFKIKVEANEGIWVEDLSALNTIKKNVIIPENLINFAETSSSSNGEGLYILPGTESNTNPIYYYRGAVTNNNVIFGDYCWQIVRTTETGGIKLAYNGEAAITGSGDNVTYDCGLTRPFQEKILSTINLNGGGSSGYSFADDYEIVSIEGNVATYRLKSKVNQIINSSLAVNTAATVSNIAENYPYTCAKTTATDTCTTLYKVNSLSSYGGYYVNVYASRDMPLIGKNDFDSPSTNISNMGYMHNAEYPYSNTSPASNSVYGKNVKWNEVSSKYLVYENDDTIASTNTTKDNNHHYTCGTATGGVGDAECSIVRYYYYNNYYITLANGDMVEDALYKMTGNIVNPNVDVVTRNAGYVLNQTDSLIKTVVDTWFETNLTNITDNTKKDYRLYLEDTVYCNDRSFRTIAGSTSTYLESGWNPNGGSLTNLLYFGNRVRNDWYSTSNVPSVECSNEADRFTVSVSNGNGALTYPVGLLTADEIVMAGAAGNSSPKDQTYFLNARTHYYTMSPLYSYSQYQSMATVNADSYLYGDFSSVGIRPVVSLKPGTEFEAGGEGTTSKPYVVKYE